MAKQEPVFLQNNDCSAVILSINTVNSVNESQETGTFINNDYMFSYNLQFLVFTDCF